MTFATYTMRTPFAYSAILQDSVVGIFNTGAPPNGVINVRRVTLFPHTGQDPSGMAKFRLSRVTSVVGGTAVAPAKHDTSAPNLPSQVTFVTTPTTVLETSTLGNRTDCPMFLPTALSTPVAPRPGGGPKMTPLDLGRVFSARMGAVVESIVLRDGEGLAVVLATFGYGHTSFFALEVTNLSTGATYTYSTRESYFPRINGMAFAALMNNTGSGVTLAVRVLDIWVTGTATMPQYRLCKVDAAGAPRLTPVAPIGHDTRSVLPPWVYCAYGPGRADLLGRNQGLPLTWEQDGGVTIPVAVQQRSGRLRQRVYAAWGKDANSVLTPPLAADKCNLLYDGSLAPISLRCGEGLAILGGREGLIDDSTFQVWHAEIVFTVETVSPLTLPGAVYVS